MKKIFLSLFCLSSIVSFSSENENYVESNFYNGGKSAVVMTHFGTTHGDTREKTIDSINQKAIKAFEGKADVFEAYTSRIINKRLSENQGISKYNTTQVLNSLKKQGYENVIIQPTNIIDGVEMESIKKEVQKFDKDFKEIRVGSALLTNPEQYKNTILAVTKAAGKLKKNEAIVMVGHGTHDSATSAYSMFDYMAKDMDKPLYVGTVEGYPTFETVNKQLKKDGKKEVILMPLMFVAGDHAKNDIAEDWKENLEKQGYQVTVKLLPLGEIKEVQDIFIENAKILEKYKPIDIVKKKEAYSKGLK